MTHILVTIEDILELLSGLQKGVNFEVNPSDKTIINSIARQTFKGTALTDRQFSLMKEKLQVHRLEFIEANYDFDTSIDNLRQPLRQIDRSKFVTIVDTLDVFVNSPYEEYKSNWKWIKVRFPFNKKLIAVLSKIISECAGEYFHKKGSHEHFFKLNEYNTYKIVDLFKDKEFKIDKELLDLFEEIKEVNSNKVNVVPGIYNEKICNLHSRVKLDKTSNMLQIIDRRLRYGLVDISTIQKPNNSLTSSIAFRNSQVFDADPDVYPMQSVVDSLNELNRFPLLVVLNYEHAEDQIHSFYNATKYLVPAQEQSVLFRQDNQAPFNDFIKYNNLNNWVDKNTKIVYIKHNKLPKLFFSSDWSPIAALTYGDRLDRNVDNYIKTRCDLIIHHSKGPSLFQRYSKYYDYM